MTDSVQAYLRYDWQFATDMLTVNHDPAEFASLCAVLERHQRSVAI